MNSLIDFYIDKHEDGKTAAFEDLQLVIRTIQKDSSRLGQRTIDYINELMIKNQLCPDCLNDLTIHNWQEDRGEYMGSISYETLSKYICESCGWEEKE